MKHCLTQIGLAVIGILTCSVIAAVLPPLWQGISGRDFRPQATVMAVLILIVSSTFRGFLRWRILNLIGALCIVEILTLTIISYFSGYTGMRILNAFNLEWLAYMNIFIGLPWVLGLGAGSIRLIIRRKRDKTSEPVRVNETP
jgi:hypothetical protein